MNDNIKIEKAMCMECTGFGYQDAREEDLCDNCQGTGIDGFRLTEEGRQFLIVILTDIKDEMDTAWGRDGDQNYDEALKLLKMEGK